MSPHSSPSSRRIARPDGDLLFIGSLDAEGTGLLDQLASKPAYRQLDAVREKHATAIDGGKWTSLGGAQAAVPVLDGIRKAMVK
ncbi:hypothetical protein [Streptomyces sp. NPDC048590]|uniref:hypothetical protein n=1 Tax=Streptomyces sp. NPDC048590 TaxID=3365574 RepID=UPI003712F4A5